MAPINLEHAALALAVIGMAVNAWVLWRIRVRKIECRVIKLGPNEALQFSAFLPPDLRNYLHAARCDCAAVGCLMCIHHGNEIRRRSHGDAAPGVQSDGQGHQTQVILNDRIPRARESPSLKCNLCDRDREMPDVHDLHGHREVVHVTCLRDGNGQHPATNANPDRVLADQPHGVEHAERSAQHRNP